MNQIWRFHDENKEDVGREPRPGGISAHFEENRRTRDRRGETLSTMRELIKEADPDIVEQRKWMGPPTRSHDGVVCTAESYKNVVKLTFANDTALKDPARILNSSLDGNTRRAIDVHEGQEVDESAFEALVREAVALNSSGKSIPSKNAKT